MAENSYRIFPLGDSALTVEFGNVISENVNRTAIAVADAVANLNIIGIIETVPAYASATVYYDPIAIRREFPDATSAFDAVSAIVEKTIRSSSHSNNESAEPIEIIVDFSPAAALDLEYVAELSGLSSVDVIEIFTKPVYRVYMLGFLPGFAYMGEIDERIATPRKDAPRLSVPAGSVGIAGRQTGIYSLPSPGGWQILGRTDAAMFDPKREVPCLLNPGDHVRFIPAI